MGNILVTASKPSAPTPSAHKSGACSPTKQPKSTKQPTPAKTEPLAGPAKPAEASPDTEQKPSGPPNKPSHQARLGLARVLMRKGGDGITEAHKLYEKVITMAPAVHDAYIELADSLIKSDPMKAVDIYSKYPFQVGFAHSKLCLNISNFLQTVLHWVLYFVTMSKL